MQQLARFSKQPNVVVVDYGMGNLFSIRRACEAVGLCSTITNQHSLVCAADAVILPGVGAFPRAMDALQRLDLLGPLRETATSGKPLVGICLGMQLLMSESHEFGVTQGLGIIDGSVVGFGHVEQAGRRLKVPHVGWNAIHRSRAGRKDRGHGGQGFGCRSGLDGLTPGNLMYFSHSFYTVPRDPRIITSTVRYGDVEFCSSFQGDRILGYQFHPECSGPAGLRVFRNLASSLDNTRRSEEEDNVVVNVAATG